MNTNEDISFNDLVVDYASDKIEQFEFVNYSEEMKLQELFKDDTKTQIEMLRVMQDCDYWSVGSYQSVSTTSESDHIVVGSLSRLYREFPGMNMNSVVPASRMGKFGLVGYTGKGDFELYASRGGVDYFVPTVDFNKIVPVKVIATKLDSCLKDSRTQLMVVQQCPLSQDGVVLIDCEDCQHKYDFPISYSGVPSMVAKGGQILLGMCYSDGVVDFPYDKKRAFLPMIAGESVICIACDVTGKIAVVDVLSRRRWLLLSLLKGICGVESQGRPFVYAIGSHLFIPSLLINFVKRTKLRVLPGYEVPFQFSSVLSEKIVARLGVCQFDWNSVFGFIPIDKYHLRKDVGPVPKMITAFMEVKSTNFRLQSPIVKVITVEDVMRHSVDVLNLGIDLTNSIFPEWYLALTIDQQLDFKFLFEMFGEDMKQCYRFEGDNLMVRKNCTKGWSNSSVSCQFLTNLFVRIWKKKKIWLVSVPDMLSDFPKRDTMYCWCVMESDSIMLDFEYDDYQLFLNIKGEDMIIGQDFPSDFNAIQLAGRTLVCGNNKNVGLIENSYCQSFAPYSMKIEDDVPMYFEKEKRIVRRGRMLRGLVGGPPGLRSRQRVDRGTVNGGYRRVENFKLVKSFSAWDG